MQALVYQKPTKFTVNEIRDMTFAKDLTEQFAKIIELPHFSSQNEFSTYKATKYIAATLGFEDTVIR